MWEISNQLQLLSFFRASVLGGFYCLAYDLLRGYRKKYECSAMAVFFQDLIYFLLISPITFCFLLVTTNGELRLYIFLGVLLGFVLIRLTLSRLFVLAVKIFFGFLLRISSLISKGITVFSAFLDRITVKSADILGVFLKKCRNSLKKVLKKQ